MAEEITLTDRNFSEKVQNTDGLLLVDFGADWCMPCRMIDPVLEDIAKQYEAELTIGKLDVDKNISVAQSMSVTGIPTLMFFKNGELVERLVGMQTAGALKSAIDKHLS